MNLIDRFFLEPELIEQPPVLFDIGASGEIHADWAALAKHSICFAFDADDREMEFVEASESDYKKLVVYNRIVVDHDASDADFYLTQSPYCSSLLAPRDGLDNWSVKNLFKTERVAKIGCIDLKSVLDAHDIQKIDWFKTDSQGTDLRLFKRLGNEIISKVLCAEFEPGILDFYHGEDKMVEVMSFMKDQPFWMNEMKVMGPERVPMDLASELFTEQEMKFVEFGNSVVAKSPGWAEMCFLNSFTQPMDRRDYLLGILFSYLKDQLGHCLLLTKQAIEKFETAGESNSEFGIKSGIFTESQSFFVETLKSQIAKRKNVRPPTWLKKIKNRIRGKRIPA